MDYLNLVPVTGVIVNVERGEDCCSQMLTLHTAGGIVNFIVDTDTAVLENRQLRAGMRVAAFYDSTVAVPLIFSAPVSGGSRDVRRKKPADHAGLF